MNMNYFPSNYAEQVVWLNNYKAKIVSLGASLGLTQAQIDEEVLLCNEMITAINNINTKETELKSARSAKKQTEKNQLVTLKSRIGRHKLHDNYTDTIGNNLGIIGAGSSFDPTDYKAKLSVEIFAGHVRLKFTKRGADGINVYHRRKAQSDWLFLARVTKSPFDDHIVLSTPNQPEHWEYRAYGVKDDEEIGTASDIVDVVYAG